MEPSDEVLAADPVVEVEVPAEAVEEVAPEAVEEVA